MSLNAEHTHHGHTQGLIFGILYGATLTHLGQKTPPLTIQKPKSRKNSTNLFNLSNIVSFVIGLKMNNEFWVRRAFFDHFHRRNSLSFCIKHCHPFTFVNEFLPFYIEMLEC